MTDNFEKIAWKLDTNQTTSVYVPLHDMNRSIQKTYPPHVDTTVLAQAFVVKAINLSDLPTFVVATDERDPVRIADLEGQEEEEGLHGVVAPVDKVPKEEVVLVGTFAADLEQLDKIVELSVNVAAYLRLMVEMREGRYMTYISYVCRHIMSPGVGWSRDSIVYLNNVMVPNEIPLPQLLQ